jgi:hypothetical protein
MNIFFLDADPAIAAAYHCDKHVSKMIVEYAQLLSTAHRMLDGHASIGVSKSGRKQMQWAHPIEDFDDLLYKVTHANHPSALWVRESASNYIWLYRLFDELCREYTKRYKKIHATQTKLYHVLSHLPRRICSENDGLTDIKPAINAEAMKIISPYVNPNECVSSLEYHIKLYRAFYVTKQVRFDMKWYKSNSTAPDWFNDLSIQMSLV